jgi:hypothetical protein
MTVRTMESPPVREETPPEAPPAPRATLDAAKDHLIAEAQTLADQLAQTVRYDLD